MLFDSGFCLPFNNINDLNLKKITSQTAKNQNCEQILGEQILRLFPKTISKTYIRVLTMFITLQKEKILKAEHRTI